MKEILNKESLKCNDVWPPAVESQTTFNPKHKSAEMRSQVNFFLFLFLILLCFSPYNFLLPIS